jgi:hypothetical protein
VPHAARRRRGRHHADLEADEAALLAAAANADLRYDETTRRAERVERAEWPTRGA